MQVGVLPVVVHPPGLRTTQEGLDEEPSGAVRASRHAWRWPVLTARMMSTGIAEAAAAFEIAESAAPCPEKKSEG